MIDDLLLHNHVRTEQCAPEGDVQLSSDHDRVRDADEGEDDHADDQRELAESIHDVHARTAAQNESDGHGAEHEELPALLHVRDHYAAEDEVDVRRRAHHVRRSDDVAAVLGREAVLQPAGHRREVEEQVRVGRVVRGEAGEQEEEGADEEERPYSRPSWKLFCGIIVPMTRLRRCSRRQDRGPWRSSRSPRRRGTCRPWSYLALEGIYLPIRAAIPNNSTRGRRADQFSLLT